MPLRKSPPCEEVVDADHAARVVRQALTLVLSAWLLLDVETLRAQTDVGRSVRYVVAVSARFDSLHHDFNTTISEILEDSRSWKRRYLLTRVELETEADFSVLLAEPPLVDSLCGEVGLATRGHLSCFTGRVVALNARRWQLGAPGFASLAEYRSYLVNHEVGHALGMRHQTCPHPNALAPIMMQQSKGMSPCRANGWPFPSNE